MSNKFLYSHPEVFCKNATWKQKVPGKTSMTVCNFCKIPRFRQKLHFFRECSIWSFPKIFRITFLQNSSRYLLLDLIFDTSDQDFKRPGKTFKLTNNSKFGKILHIPAVTILWSLSGNQSNSRKKLSGHKYSVGWKQMIIFPKRCKIHLFFK